MVSLSEQIRFLEGCLVIYNDRPEYLMRIRTVLIELRLEQEEENT